MEDQEKETSAGVASWMIPSAAAGTITYLKLKDRAGKTIGKMEIPMEKPGFNSGKIAENTVDFPSHFPQSNSVEVSGDFDGEMSNTEIDFDGNSGDILAESEHGVFVNTPDDVVGETEVTITENGNEFSETCNVLDLSMTADQLDLSTGQTATVTVTVSGLEGLDTPVDFDVVNTTPNVIDMEGGMTDVITILPSDITADGTYSHTFPVTAKKPGAFSVASSIHPDTSPRSFSEVETEEDPASELNDLDLDLPESDPTNDLAWDDSSGPAFDPTNETSDVETPIQDVMRELEQDEEPIAEGEEETETEDTETEETLSEETQEEDVQDEEQLRVHIPDLNENEEYVVRRLIDSNRTLVNERTTSPEFTRPVPAGNSNEDENVEENEEEDLVEETEEEESVEEADDGVLEVDLTDEEIADIRNRAREIPEDTPLTPSDPNDDDVPYSRPIPDGLKSNDYEIGNAWRTDEIFDAIQRRIDLAREHDGHPGSGVPGYPTIGFLSPAEVNEDEGTGCTEYVYYTYETFNYLNDWTLVHEEQLSPSVEKVITEGQSSVDLKEHTVSWEVEGSAGVSVGPISLGVTGRYGESHTSITGSISHSLVGTQVWFFHIGRLYLHRRGFVRVQYKYKYVVCDDGSTMNFVFPSYEDHWHYRYVWEEEIVLATRDDEGNFHQVSSIPMGSSIPESRHYSYEADGLDHRHFRQPGDFYPEVN